MMDMESKTFVRWTARRRFDALLDYRRYRSRISKLSKHELDRWEALTRHFGLSQHELNQWETLTEHDSEWQPSTTTLTEFRTHTTRDTLGITVTFSSGGQVEDFDAIDENLLLGKEHKNLTAQESLFYYAITVGTARHRVCTFADLAHILWPSDLQALPSVKIFHVLACKINQKLPEDALQIESVWGRGYRLSSPKVTEPTAA